MVLTLNPKSVRNGVSEQRQFHVYSEDKMLIKAFDIKIYIIY